MGCGVGELPKREVIGQTLQSTQPEVLALSLIHIYYAAFSKQQKTVMEGKVVDGGLLEEARKKAGEVISQLLETANPEYTIQVQEAKEA